VVGVVTTVAAPKDTAKPVTFLVTVTDSLMALHDGPLTVRAAYGGHSTAARLIKRYHVEDNPANPVQELGCLADAPSSGIRKGDEVCAEVGAWHGTYAAWFENGSRACEGECSHGMRVGAWTFWYADGNVCCQGQFSMSRRSGTWNYWHPDGSNRAVTQHGTSQFMLRVQHMDYVQEARDASGALLPPFELDHYLCRAVSARSNGLAVAPIIAEADRWFAALESVQWRLDLCGVLENFRTVAEKTSDLPDAEGAEALSNARDRVIHWRNNCFPPVPGMDWGWSMPVPTAPANLDGTFTRHFPPQAHSPDPQEP
jgi:hypothetical protein